MAAGVPQGSFTNHFRSKEAFGILVLDRYAERIDAIMRETLGDDTRAGGAAHGLYRSDRGIRGRG